MSGGSNGSSEAPHRRRRWLGRILLLVFLVALAGMALLLWGLGPRVPARAVLVVDLRRAVPERREEGLAHFLGAPEIDLLGLRRALQVAQSDPRIRGVLLLSGAGGVDLAQAEEIRGMVGEFSSGGKFAIGFAEGPDAPGYLVASAAELVVVDPAAEIHLVGISLQALFLAEALRGLGIEFDLVRVGEFKGTYEQLTGQLPTPEFQRALEETAEALHAVLVEEIASSRKITPAQVRTAIDEGPLSPARAVEARLADRIAYHDELRRIVEERCGGEAVEAMAAADYLEAVGERAAGARLSVIHVRGLITDAAGPPLPYLGEVTGADEVVAALREAREDVTVRGVLLRIDSPGGTLSGAERIWREVGETRKQKPVVATLGPAAASGGYYIACGADRVLARPATITGSIGVFGGKIVVERLLSSRGVRVEVASRGRRAGMFDITRRFTDDQRAALVRVVDDAYRQFVDRVSVGRKKPLEEVERLARGRVWTGTQALERGLIDELGGIEEAVAAVRRLARIPDGEAVDLVPLPARGSILDFLTRRRKSRPLLRGLPALSDLQALLGLLDGKRPLALSPVRLIVN